MIIVVSFTDEELARMSIPKLSYNDKLILEEKVSGYFKVHAREAILDVIASGGMHLITTPEYWVCDCTYRYPHGEYEKECEVCGRKKEVEAPFMDAFFRKISEEE